MYMFWQVKSFFTCILWYIAIKISQNRKWQRDGVISEQSYNYIKLSSIFLLSVPILNSVPVHTFYKTPLYPWRHSVGMVGPTCFANPCKHDSYLKYMIYENKQEAERATYCAPEYNVPPFWRISQSAIFVFWSARKHKLGRGHWDLASCKVSLNSVQRFQRRSKNCLSQSEARAAILFFRSARKHKLGRVHWDLASCQVSLNAVQRFQRRSRKCLSQSEASAAILFFWSAQKHKLGRGRWDLASCQVLLNSVQRFQRRSRKCLSQSEARAAILFFRSALKAQTW